MEMWLGDLDLSGGPAFEVVVEPLIPEHKWRAAATNPPPEWLTENPDLAELDVYLNGFYA